MTVFGRQVLDSVRQRFNNAKSAPETVCGVIMYMLHVGALVWRERTTVGKQGEVGRVEMFIGQCVCGGQVTLRDTHTSRGQNTMVRFASAHLTIDWVSWTPRSIPVGHTGNTNLSSHNTFLINIQCSSGGIHYNNTWNTLGLIHQHANHSVSGFDLDLNNKWKKMLI